jgi:hypothetical protein
MEKKVFKLGIDLHGVSDTASEFFTLITKLLIADGNEIHLMTGSHEGEKLTQQLKEAGVNYTHFFSISDYLKTSGKNVRYDDKGNPWFSNEDWDSAKSEYAEENNIDLVIDDTERYNEYFTTPFAYMKIDMKD